MDIRLTVRYVNLNLKKKDIDEIKDENSIFAIEEKLLVGSKVLRKEKLKNLKNAFNKFYKENKEFIVEIRINELEWLDD